MRFFKSAKHVYCQIIDDVAHHTVVYAGTVDRDIKKELFENQAKTDSLLASRILGLKIARACRAKRISKVKLDLGRYGPRQGCNRVNPRLGIAMEACREQGMTLVPKRGLNKGHSKTKRKQREEEQELRSGEIVVARNPSPVYNKLVKGEQVYQYTNLYNIQNSNSKGQNVEGDYFEEESEQQIPRFENPGKFGFYDLVDQSQEEQEEDIFGNKVIIDESSEQVEDLVTEQLNRSRKIYLASGLTLQRKQKTPAQQIRERKVTQKLEHLRKITSPNRRLKSEYRKPVKKLEKQLRIEWDQNIKKYKKNFGGEQTVIRKKKFDYEDGSDYGVDFSSLLNKIEESELQPEEMEEERRKRIGSLPTAEDALKMLEKPQKLLGQKGRKKKAREIVKQRAKGQRKYDDPNRDMVVMGAGYSSASLIKKDYKK